MMRIALLGIVLAASAAAVMTTGRSAAAEERAQPVQEVASGGRIAKKAVDCGAVRPNEAMLNAYGFITQKMRGSDGGVFTNFKDSNTKTDVYVYGHHVTSEHMGLMLLAAAGMNDRVVFEQTFKYIQSRMISPRVGLIAWAIDKKTQKPYTDPAAKDPRLYNSTMDDFRIVSGLAAGWDCWQDEKYLELALSLGRALLEKCVSSSQFPKFPTGLVTNGCEWSEKTGVYRIQAELVPINYADLWAMRWLADHDPRWRPVIDNSVRFMKASQIAPTGQFQNAYFPDGSYGGDWEYQKNEVGVAHVAATKIKTIQSLWTAIHLARIGHAAPAKEALAFYTRQYRQSGRVSEYYNRDGSVPTDKYFREETHPEGEARIYALLARLAYHLGEKELGDEIVDKSILGDQVNDRKSPLFGYIGLSTSSEGDGDAWNVLESLTALAMRNGSPVATQTFAD